MSDPSTPASPATRTVEGVELPAPGTYVLDPSHTHVGFSVRHMMVSKVKGRFSAVSGTVTIAEDPLASLVDVEIEVASIDTRDDTRDGHLRSPDFFDAESFPSMRYQSSSVSSVGKGRFTVAGDLTIRDVTRPVELEVDFEGAAKDPWGNMRIGFSASGELDREAFGLTWNQALETGGVVVGKNISLELEAEGVREN